MEPPLHNILKADAVAKSGNDTRVGTSDWRGGDSKVGAEHDNQPLNNEGLVLKQRNNLWRVNLGRRGWSPGGRRCAKSDETEEKATDDAEALTPRDEETIVSSWEGVVAGLLFNVKNPFPVPSSKRMKDGWKW
jgi:hypothetical protein